MSGAPEGKFTLVKKNIFTQKQMDNLLSGKPMGKGREYTQKEIQKIFEDSANQYRQKHWPYDTYFSDIRNLTNRIGQRFFFSPDLINTYNVNLADIIDLRENEFTKELLKKHDNKSIYPHSVLLGKSEIEGLIGSVINLREITLIAKPGFDISLIRGAQWFENMDHKDIFYLNIISAMYHNEFEVSEVR